MLPPSTSRRADPILIDKYLEGMEVEVDAICDGEQVLIPGIMEHIERAGVHSGDSMAVYPAPSLTPAQRDAIIDYTISIGLGLQVKGLMNIQYVVMKPSDTDERERGDTPRLRPRSKPPRQSHRPVPLQDHRRPYSPGSDPYHDGQVPGAAGLQSGGLWPAKDIVAIKAPVFSMSKLIGVDTFLGPEMKSTGEVMGIDHSLGPALAKALLASDMMLPPKGAVLLSIADRDKAEALDIVRMFASLSYKLYATQGTAEMIQAIGLPVTAVVKAGTGHPRHRRYHPGWHRRRSSQHPDRSPHPSPGRLPDPTRRRRETHPLLHLPGHRPSHRRRPRKRAPQLFRKTTSRLSGIEPQMMEDRLAKVLANHTIAPGVHCLWVDSPSVAESRTPGEFVMAECGDTSDPLLRRAISIHRYGPDLLAADPALASDWITPDSTALLFNTGSAARTWLANRGSR